MSMSTIETPSSEDEICELVQHAARHNKMIEIVGGGTKRHIGQPLKADIQLNTNQLTGIVDYTPSELVMSAKAGTPLADIEAHLDQHGQMLAFEPVDYGPLMGQQAQSTIGGVFATNLSGSRRLSAGAARDALLGVRFINGKGQVIKTGGKVMKNVTGLDMVKLQAGAWGTLGVMFDVTFKVLPKPQTATTILLRGLSDQAAAKAMAKAMAQTVDVSSCAHLPASLLSGFMEGAAGEPVTCFRLEGLDASVQMRSETLISCLADFGEMSRLDAGKTAQLWRKISSIHAFHGKQDSTVWKISLPPMAGHQLVRTITDMADIEAFYDWQGGLVWLACNGDDPQAERIRKAAKGFGGYATLIRASEDIRLQVPTFEPEPKPVADLSRRIQTEIDPNRVFSPARMLFHSGLTTQEAV